MGGLVSTEAAQQAQSRPPAKLPASFEREGGRKLRDRDTARIEMHCQAQHFVFLFLVYFLFILVHWTLPGSIPSHFIYVFSVFAFLSYYISVSFLLCSSLVYFSSYHFIGIHLEDFLILFIVFSSLIFFFLS